MYSFPSGTQGWVSATYLASNLKPFTFLPLWDGTPPEKDGQSGLPLATVVNAYHLNVRQGPGVNYGVATTINRGQQVALAGYRNENATWVKVKLIDGTQGWVNAYYINSTYPLANLVVGGW